MTKRLFDISLSLLGLLILSPFIFVFAILVFLQDYKPPFFIADRVGKDGVIFKMIKLRSMVVDANKSGVNSTSTNDPRITKIGIFIRRFKLDELTQLINVFRGQMSLVGPRPNVKSETDNYSVDEKQLLNIKPGITDFSSIIFSDEGDILKNSLNPDLDYNQLIRPWKSRLGLLYLERRSHKIDITLIYLTLLSVISRKRAIKNLIEIIRRLSNDKMLIEVCKRDKALVPYPPPGLKEVVKKV